jgi:integral membrane protein (TIGR01906 family)
VVRRVLATIALILFALAIPVALITTNVNALVFDASFYERGQVRHAVGQTTEFPIETLRPINRGIVRFFSVREISLPEALAAEGADAQVFGAREVHHMDDVRGLIQLSSSLQMASLAVIGLYFIAGIAISGRSHLASVASGTLWGSGLTLGLLVLFGVLAATDFSTLFTRFHLISFSNDLWILDPRTDNLIRIFPFYFWYDATVSVIIRTVVAALLLAVAGGLAILGPGRRLVTA